MRAFKNRRYFRAGENIVVGIIRADGLFIQRLEIPHERIYLPAFTDMVTQFLSSADINADSQPGFSRKCVCVYIILVT